VSSQWTSFYCQIWPWVSLAVANHDCWVS